MGKKRQKAQLHIPADLCLKFQAKLLSGYGDTLLRRFWLKNSTENISLPYQ